MQEYYLIGVLALVVIALLVKSRSGRKEDKQDTVIHQHPRLDEALSVLMADSLIRSLLVGVSIVIEYDLMVSGRSVAGYALDNKMVLNKFHVDNLPHSQIMGLVLHELAHIRKGFDGLEQGEMAASIWAGDQLERLTGRRY